MLRIVSFIVAVAAIMVIPSLKPKPAKMAA